jgi:type IV pilus assembly protein PilA
MRLLREHLRAEPGFALVEVLVVIILLGILAALTLPMFLGHAERGDDVAAKSDARGVATAVEQCFAETNDYAECDEESQLDISGLSWGAGDGQVEVISSAAKEFAVRATSKSGHRFTWSKPETGPVDRDCAPSGEGGCGADGSW